MKKSTKGALAAAAAGTMLVGGYGSLATWTSTQTVTGGTITAGTLSLSAPKCDNSQVAGTHDWQWASGTAAGTAFSFTDNTVVPGDTINKVCQVVLTMAGDHIKADLAIPSATIGSGATLTQLAPTTTYSVNGSEVAGPVRSFAGAGTKTVLVSITVEFPSTVGNQDGQGMSAALQGLAITATQTS